MNKYFIIIYLSINEKVYRYNTFIYININQMNYFNIYYIFLINN